MPLFTENKLSHQFPEESLDQTYYLICAEKYLYFLGTFRVHVLKTQVIVFYKVRKVFFAFVFVLKHVNHISYIFVIVNLRYRVDQKISTLHVPEESK